jgi:hypothetical protein
MILPVALLAGLLQQGMVAAPSPSPSPSPPPPDAKTIVERAIKARGGEDALKRAMVLEWRGRGRAYAGDRTVVIDGRWIVEPPDRAVVATWEADKGPSSTRRLILLGPEGWTERDGARTPMPVDMLADERDRFYLYSLLRVLPLRDPGTRLTATGPRTLRVEREGRPTVDMFFDGTGWLDRLRVERRDPGAGTAVVEEVTFAGEIAAGGVRWPRRINVSRDGTPFFDLDITTLRIATAADLTREAGRK